MARLALLAALLAGVACATTEPPPPGPRATTRSMPVSDTVEEARDALPGVVRYDRRLVLQGELRIVVGAPVAELADSALAAGFAAADSVVALVGGGADESEIAAINERAGVGPVEVSRWTEELVVTSLRWAERTGGAFDPTIGPVARLWGFGRGGGEAPTDATIAAAMERVGWEKVEHDPAAHTVFLTRDGMVLDLRAAAKGFALDRMREAMEAAGATGGAIDLDGNLLLFGSASEDGSDRWKVTLADPYAPATGYARLDVPPGALSTSAALKRTIEFRGERYGHLIDPRTGRPVEGLASVTVYAPSGLVADILSTALYVLGAEEGRALIEQRDEAEAIFVVESQIGERAEVIVTEGFEPFLEQVVPPLRPAFREDVR